MELTEVLEFSRADMTRIVSLRLKEDREKRRYIYRTVVYYRIEEV